jgi:transcriptional regulator with XRE-family HTH domain
MSWNSEKIRDLRLRLGWSISDLARRLNCESSQISIWEKGESQPTDTYAQTLELISHQADESSEEVMNSSLAEKFLEESELSQCDLNLVKDKYF